MKSLESLTRRFLAGAFWLMGLVPLPPISQLYWLLLSLGIRCCWIVYISYLLGVGFNFGSGAIDSVGNVVGTALFMGCSVLGLLLLLESVLKQRTHTQLEDLRIQSELQLQRLGMFGRRRQAGYLWSLMGTQIMCDVVRGVINGVDQVSPVFNISVPLSWLLRLRYVQLVQLVIDLNQRSLQLRRSLLCLAAGNDLWQPYGVQECRQLQTLRTTYERIFECYEALSDCYGWGMLGLHLLTSFEFVTNAYWILMHLYDPQNQDLASLIFNAATAIDFGTMIATLFWHGDAGAENVASRVVLKVFHLVLVFFSLSSTRLPPLILWIRFLAWIAWYVYIFAHRLQISTLDCNLDCMLRYMLAVCHTASHVFLLATTFIQGCRENREQADEVTMFEASDPWVAFTVLAMLAPILGAQYLVWFNVSGNDLRLWNYHLKMLPSSLALQLQILSFISEVMEVNVRVRLAKRQLLTLARELSSRWPQCKYQPDCLDRQTYRIEALKRRYNELYLLYDRINAKFGGSLLFIIIVCFANFVCTSYWLFVDVRTTPRRRVMAILVKMAFIFNEALQMSAACWHCQQSTNLGRQIGCLISKLVKPQGSKRYNELVSEFSLQTLHQRFVVTAKDFFSLNLHLLSSMFAAVVTYLVILIQFMFAERSARGNSE